jgi:hypothetical protein
MVGRVATRADNERSPVRAERTPAARPARCSRCALPQHHTPLANSAQPAHTNHSAATVARAQKHIVITGGNTGIGYEAALELAKKDFAVTLACRDDAKAAAAATRIKAAVPSASVETLHLDLADLDSVRWAAGRAACMYDGVGSPLGGRSSGQVFSTLPST